MLRMEAKLPGFGGWFLASDTFNVYMKQPSSASTEDVQRIFYDTYSGRPEEYVRRLIALGPQVKIIPGRYSLSELIAIENLFLHTTKRVPLAGPAPAHRWCTIASSLDSQIVRACVPAQPYSLRWAYPWMQSSSRSGELLARSNV
jgi:hypothetical protein